MSKGRAAESVGAEDGGMMWHAEILNRRQRQVLLPLAVFARERGFYLAGGTAAALWLGHRRSLDFDWFSTAPVGDVMRLAADLRAKGISFRSGGTAPGTLHGSVRGVRVSFLEYRYPLLKPVARWPENGCPVVSLEDIACMKLSAVAQRGARRDFVDLHAIGRRVGRFEALLAGYRKKFATTDVGPVLYGLSYFDDAEKDPMPRMLSDITWEEIKMRILSWVRALA
ncbi:MAG: nucleotidyl transferase AbiEii/AbiGii toxin family protein [Planctomycetota bacterium]